MSVYKNDLYGIHAAYSTNTEEQVSKAKLLTNVEYEVIKDVINYIQEHAHTKECMDCFSYDIQTAVGEAMDILESLEDVVVE